MTERVRAVIRQDDGWRCAECGKSNPTRPGRTRCLGCDAPLLGGDEPPEIVRRLFRPRRGRWIMALTWLYAAIMLTILALINWVGEAWWGVTVLLFVPRWLFLGPVILLALASALNRRPAHWILQGTVALVIAGPLMGFTVAPERLWMRRADGISFRLMTYNLGAGTIDAARLIQMIERERIDFLCFQEGVAKNPVIEAYLAKGWHRDRSKFVASRYPIVADLGPLKDRTPTDELYTARLSRIRVRTPEGIEVVVASVHLPTIRTGLNRFLEGDPAGLKTHLQWWSSELGRVVAAVCESGDYPLLVGGDFNMPSDDSSMATLRSVFRFGFEEAGLGYGYTRPSRAPWFRIDHLLASPKWRFTRCWVGPDFGSDHLPLIAEVVLPRPAPSPSEASR